MVRRNGGGARGLSGGGRAAPRLMIWSRLGLLMSRSMKLLIVEGERNARLKEARIEWSRPGLYIAEILGENVGSSRLPNLSTRAPIAKRNLSKKISSWK